MGKEYNFDIAPDRRGTGSYKWDGSADPDMLPMWVADMDFTTAPAVIEALRRRVDHGVFGYVKVPDSYYESLSRWFGLRHGWSISKESVIYTIGVVPAISAIIKAFTNPGDGVVIQTPAYNCFFSSVRNNGCRVVENPLARIDTADGFRYGMDFKKLEEAVSPEDVKLLILCNPHNPTGRVWTRHELETLRDICRRHDVRVISDEIHCELVHPGFDYVPYATVDPMAVVCCSPSKAFNIAGLQIANIVAPAAGDYKAIDRAININEVCDVNPFGVVGLQAAYNEGGRWLDELNDYLYENYVYLRRVLAERMPQINVCDSESTYLAWIDVRALGMSATEVEEHCKEATKVWVNAGTMYGDDGYIRINYACPRSTLADGLDRFCRAFGR